MERIRGIQVVGMVLSLVGVVIFLADKARGGVGIATVGDLLSLLAALFYAAYTVSLKPLLSRYLIAGEGRLTGSYLALITVHSALATLAPLRPRAARLAAPDRALDRRRVAN